MSEPCQLLNLKLSIGHYTKPLTGSQRHDQVALRSTLVLQHDEGMTNVLRFVCV